jgi:hypothetical protein
MIPDVFYMIAIYWKFQGPWLMMISRCVTWYTVKSVIRPVALSEVRILFNKHVTIQEIPDQKGRMHGRLVTVDQNILSSKMCPLIRSPIPAHWREDEVQEYRLWGKNWRSHLKKAAGRTAICIRERVYVTVWPSVSEMAVVCLLQYFGNKTLQAQ